MVPSRIKWDFGPTFDPLPYLDKETRALFLDPDYYRLPDEAWSLGKVKVYDVHASRAHAFEICRMWDRVGSLRLFPLDSRFRLDELCGLFRVYKDEHIDRLILNPSTRNSRVVTPTRYTKCLGQGWQMCRLYIPPGCHLEISSDDLREYYTCFKVNRLRAQRNRLRH